MSAWFRTPGRIPRPAALSTKTRANRQSLALYREQADRSGIALCLAELASVASEEGDLGLAARLSGATEALLTTGGARLEPADRADYDRCVAAARAGLNEAAFAAAWQEALAIPLDQVMEAALGEAQLAALRDRPQGEHRWGSESSQSPR